MERQKIKEWTGQSLSSLLRSGIMGCSRSNRYVCFHIWFQEAASTNHVVSIDLEELCRERKNEIPMNPEWFGIQNASHLFRWFHGSDVQGRHDDLCQRNSGWISSTRTTDRRPRCVGTSSLRTLLSQLTRMHQLQLLLRVETRRHTVRAVHDCAT